MKIGEKTFISLSYELTVDGKVADSATADRPLEFIFGAGFLLPKFEENINGLKQGADFKFTLNADEGYGEKTAEAIVELPKDIFTIDGSVEEGLLEIGNTIPMSTSDGRPMMGIVAEVLEQSVKMDFNHPMAGKTLNFAGTIVGVREATEQDMMSMMGGDGGCSNCGDGECGDCGDGDCNEEGGCACGGH